MLTAKRIFFSSFGVAAFLVGATLAHTDSSIPSAGGEISFDCTFHGSESCTAEGQFGRVDGDLGNADSHHDRLKLECQNGNLYEDAARVHFDRSSRTLVIDGIEEPSPEIVIDLGDRVSSPLGVDRIHRSDLYLAYSGQPLELAGECHLHRQAGFH